jgi:hypothetical protein
VYTGYVRSSRRLGEERLHSSVNHHKRGQLDALLRP